MVNAVNKYNSVQEVDTHVCLGCMLWYALKILVYMNLIFFAEHCLFCIIYV